MIRRTCLLVFGLALIEFSNAQNPYFFKEYQIWINSPVPFNTSNQDKSSLETDGLKVQFNSLTGMEGVNNLVSSLDSYANSFGYRSPTKASLLALKNLPAAYIETESNNQKIILVMLATRDYNQHFLCEVKYRQDKKIAADAIVKSIYINENSASAENKSSNETVTIKTNIDSGYSNSSITTSPVTNSHKGGTKVESITWKLLSLYSPDGYIIIDDYLKAPAEYNGVSTSGNSDFTIWIEGTEEKDIVNSLNTVVHEMCHGYTGKLYLKLLKDEGKQPSDGSYSAFYLGNHMAKLVKHTDLFATNEINSIYPEKLKTSRYATYIYPSEKIMSSQQDGCYGLLDELNAYYWGTRTSFDLYKYFKTQNNTQRGWSNFFSDFYGTSYAYLEFKSYILYYLIYARDNHKEAYDAIIANKDFLEALQKIDENWWKLITDFNKLRQTIINTEKNKGVDIYEEGGFLYIGYNGIGNFSEIYNLYRTELLDKKFQDIARSVGLKSSSAPELFNE